MVRARSFIKSAFPVAARFTGLSWAPGRTVIAGAAPSLPLKGARLFGTLLPTHRLLTIRTDCLLCAHRAETMTRDHQAITVLRSKFGQI